MTLACLEDGPADDGARTGLFWLGGFMSDMTGTKAEALAAIAREDARPCLRFDYSGHGASSGAFTDGTISRWRDEALHLFRTRTKGSRLIVGSSMGGWLAALLYRALSDAERARVAGLLLIAPAHDFTEALMWPEMSAAARAALEREGVCLRPSAYGAPYPITRALIEDGRNNLLLGRSFGAACPVHILQGEDDRDVPMAHARRIYADIAAPAVHFTLVKGGDHRLSSPADLALLQSVARGMLRQSA